MTKKWYVHKHEVAQSFGGSEEGGWWFETGVPAEDWVTVGFVDEEAAYEYCRGLNEGERVRAEKFESYGYTSVLSYMSTHYAYGVFDEPEAKSYPEFRPHYE